MRKKDDEKQRNIKKAVVKLILEEGLHGTSISKIAKEAGVSPATVYIYYENKEMMLKDIYLEYSEDIFCYLLSKIDTAMDGKKLIETLIHNYFSFIQQNNDVFHFVEQFSSCPALSNRCEAMKGIYPIYNLFDDLKNKKVLKDFHNDNLLAVIFSPVKAISNNLYCTEEERLEMLQEIVEIIQDALLL
jgi:AcrR family transcriptional regulator